MNWTRSASILGMLMMLALPQFAAAGPEGDGSGRADASATFIRMELPFAPEFTCAAWMPDGSSMVVAGPDGWILRYYPANGTFVNVSARGMSSIPDYFGVAISPATSDALIVGQGGVAVLVAPDNRVAVQPTGTENDLLAASFSPDGSLAFLAGTNRTLIRFDAAQKKMTVQDDLLMPDLIQIPTGETFGKCSFRPGGQYALLAAPEAGKLYRITDSSLLDITYKFTGLAEPRDIAWTPDGASALVVDNRSRAFLWDGNGESTVRVDGPRGSQMVLAAWRNDSSASLLALGTGPGLYSYSGLPALSSVQPLEVSSFWAMSWSPDGREGFIFAVDGPDRDAYHFREGDLSPALELVRVGPTTAALAWNWNGTSAQDHTDIYISTDEGAVFDTIPLTILSEKSHIFSPLKPGAKYFAAVRVYFATVPPVDAKSSILSFATPGQNTVPKPSTPVLSDINSTAVYLTWSWSPGASGEKLDHYLLLHSTSQADLLNATPLNAYTNTTGRLYNLVPSTKYYLMIRVVTQTNLTADSDVQSFSTTAFSIPNPVSLELTGYRLQWRASSSPNVSKYDLYYAQRTGQTVEQMAFVTTYPAGQANYAYDLSPHLGTTYREGSTYYFRVRTVNRDGGTGDSEQIGFTYDIAPTRVSTGAVTDITYNSVRLTWGKSTATDFAAYVIEYREYLSGSWKTALKVTDRNTTSAVVGSLAPDTRYDFRIKVQDRTGKTSATSDWATHPRTDENIPYEIFATVFGDPAVCLPISFIMMFMTTAAAVGMRKSGKGRGSTVFGAFAAGFALLFLGNLLSLMDIMQFSPEQKLLLFLLPLPVVAAIALARRGRVRRAEAKKAEEARRREAEEAAARRQKRADDVRATLAALGPRLEALERMPGQASTAAARTMFQQAGWAYGSGNLDSAQDLAQRAESGIRQMEESNRDRQSQAEAITKRLETVDTHLRTLIDHWLKYDPAAELGLDPLRPDRARLEAARKGEDARLQSAQAKQQQAGVLLGQGRMAEARDVAAAAQSEVDRMLDAWNRWKDLKDMATSLLVAIEKAASWASLDSRAFRRRVEDARLELAVQDSAAASTALNAIRAELDALGQTHRPALAIALPPVQYHLNRFEDFQFTVRNAGKAIARKIDIALEAPADFGPGGNQPTVKLVSMAAGGSQDCRLNLAFTREGSVPVLFTLSCEDNVGSRVVQDPVRLTVNVMGR